MFGWNQSSHGATPSGHAKANSPSRVNPMTEQSADFSTLEDTKPAAIVQTPVSNAVASGSNRNHTSMFSYPEDNLFNGRRYRENVPTPVSYTAAAAPNHYQRVPGTEMMPFGVSGPCMYAAGFQNSTPFQPAHFSNYGTPQQGTNLMVYPQSFYSNLMPGVGVHETPFKESSKHKPLDSDIEIECNNAFEKFMCPRLRDRCIILAMTTRGEAREDETNARKDAIKNRKDELDKLEQQEKKKQDKELEHFEQELRDIEREYQKKKRAIEQERSEAKRIHARRSNAIKEEQSKVEELVAFDNFMRQLEREGHFDHRMWTENLLASVLEQIRWQNDNLENISYKTKIFSMQCIFDMKHRDLMNKILRTAHENGLLRNVHYQSRIVELENQNFFVPGCSLRKIHYDRNMNDETHAVLVAIICNVDVVEYRDLHHPNYRFRIAHGTNEAWIQ